MSSSANPNPPSASPRPGWSRRRIAILLGLCLCGGCATWCLWGFGRSTERITVNVIVRNDVDQQPVGVVRVHYVDHNHKMPIWVPRWFALTTTGYCFGTEVWTDGKGKATLRIPNHVHPQERKWCFLYLDTTTLPQNIGSKEHGYPLRVHEGKLFEDDEILIRLVHEPRATQASPSAGDSKATPIDR